MAQAIRNAIRANHATKSVPKRPLQLEIFDILQHAPSACLAHFGVKLRNACKLRNALLRRNPCFCVWEIPELVQIKRFSFFLAQGHSMGKAVTGDFVSQKSPMGERRQAA